MNDSLRFDYLLAALVFFVWARMIMYLRGFSQFGPMFRMIQAMIVDLGQFMVIWVSIQLMFASVAVLVFGNLETFKTLHGSIIYWYQASIGSFDMSVF
jgi:hypothetical protein